MSSPITTHILDTSLGRPAAGVKAVLTRKDQLEDGGVHWVWLGDGTTNDDGRIADLLPAGTLVEGVYQITFLIGEYFKVQETQAFYPEASIVFEVQKAHEHYHVPLLLNPFGYSTYRGS